MNKLIKNAGSIADAYKNGNDIMKLRLLKLFMNNNKYISILNYYL